MNNIKSEVVNSKAGRTTEVKAEPRNNISILEALEAKYNLPVTAVDWREPTVQVLDKCLSTIPDDFDGETDIMTLKMSPIRYCGSSKRFFSTLSSEKYVSLEECVFDDDENYRIDLSFLAARLKEMAND